MSREIEEMKKDLSECHTIDEWAAREYGEAYTDFYATAEKMLDRGWRKQSEGIANNATTTEWISVEERLPKPYKSVLVFCRNGFKTFQSVSEMLDENGRRWSAVCGIPVTHWMPLPAPPKGGEG
jgi:hypothetical protein